MENGSINKQGVKQLVQQALDRLNSESVKQSLHLDQLAKQEIESARILLEVVIRDYLK